MPTEVIPTNHPYDDDLYPPGRSAERDARLDDLTRRQGAKFVHDIHAMARPHLFDEDDTVEVFESWLRATRGWTKA
jgi:hypothetical protein